MKKNPATTYAFRTYSIWAVIAFLAILIPITVGLVAFFRFLHLETVPEAIIKVLIIGLAVGWLLLVRRWISVSTEAQLDLNGLIFVNLPYTWRFARADYFIFWNEIEEWIFKEGSVSAHTFAPSVFELKLSGQRKITIWVADEKAFNQFLTGFKASAEGYNLKNRAMQPIEQRKPFQPKKWVSYIFISLTFLSGAILALLMGMGYLWEGQYSQTERMKYVGAGLLFLFIWGLAVNAIYQRKD